MRIGIDLGGTKIEGLVLDAGGMEIARHRIPTPRDDYRQTLAAIASMVQTLEGNLEERCSVGVGTPGVLSPVTRLMKNANSVCLNGKPLGSDLSETLGRPVRLANDANCFALSEAVDGAGKNASVVFGVIVGTGTGGGIVMNRRVHTGPNAVAGEWGHNPLPWPGDTEVPGPPCYCGREGCVETYLSGPGMTRDHRAQTGDVLEPGEIAERAEQGDAACVATLERYVDRMARGLASVLNVLDPDVVVLGGGMSKLSRLYHEVPKRWGRYVFSDRVGTPLLPPVHGDAGGVRGAAWLWSEETPGRFS